MTPERKLKKVTIALMRSPLFVDWSGVVMLGKKTIDDHFPTAATDGWDEIYGRKFVNEVNDKELAFAVLHEGGHKLYRHLTVWKRLFELDPQIANMACDHVLNLQIIARDPDGTVVELPKRDGKPWVCYDLRFKGMHTRQVFDILMEEKKARGGKPGEPEAGEGGGGQPGGEPFDHHDWGAAKERGKAEQDQIDKEIDQAVRQGQITAQKIAGKGAGNMDRDLLDLLDPKIDWREVLREFVSAHCKGRESSTWRRPNRRYLGQGMYLPTLVGERVESIVIGSDTSGSISQVELSKGISEIAGIISEVHPERLDMVYWDSSVAGHEVYDDANMDTFVNTTKPKGGGGTDPTSMMRYLKAQNIKPDCIIQFTDGYIGDWGSEWDCPILWVIIGGNRTLAPCGVTIRLED